jgi:hypothetical protein
VRYTDGNDFKVTQTGSPSMNVLVLPGQAGVDGTENISQGLYHAYNDASVQLAISPSSPTLGRIDRVVLTVRDQFYSGTNNDAFLQVVPGTPAASPVPPAMPGNSIALARITVAANASSIGNGVIIDDRPFLGSLLAPADPRGVVLPQFTGGPTTATTPTAVTIIGSHSFSAIAGRYYKFEWFSGLCSGNSGTELGHIGFRIDSVEVGFSSFQIQNAGGPGQITSYGYFITNTLSTTTHTTQLTLARTSNGTSVTVDNVTLIGTDLGTG